jgi:ribA/ribD-fused uncharacterized protein
LTLYRFSTLKQNKMRETEKYVLFWSGIYSQWYAAPMMINGIKFNTCEQYMMYQKALLFKDEEVANEIMKETNPRNQKALGRKIRNFNDQEWKQNCMRIVYEANLAKFTQNPELRAALLSTGDKILVEASPKDFIWGIGMHYDDEGVENPANWKGTNLLGQTLTLVKHEIK